MALGGRGLGLCPLTRRWLILGDLDLPQDGEVAVGIRGLVISTLPARPSILAVLAPRLPVSWRPDEGLAVLVVLAGRIVFCTQRPSPLLNSCCRALLVPGSGSVGETDALVPCLGHGGLGRGSPPIVRR